MIFCQPITGLNYRPGISIIVSTIDINILLYPFNNFVCYLITFTGPRIGLVRYMIYILHIFLVIYVYVMLL